MNETLKYHLRNWVKLRAFTPQLSTNLFFIFGCQRSGTTLLLSILNAHPQITSVDESEFPSPYPFPSALRLAANKITDRYLLFKMLQHSDKLDFLKKYYPKSKIIWVVRNPHSVISSMLNLTNSEGDWIERCVQDEISKLIPFFGEDITSLNLSEHSKVELGAIYWLYKNKYYQFLIENGFELLLLKYEDLVQDQRKTLQQVVDFFEIEWNDNLLNFHKINPSKTLAGGTKTDKPINAKSSKNLEKLSAKDIEIINDICQPLMNCYGYTAIQGMRSQEQWLS